MKIIRVFYTLYAIILFILLMFLFGLFIAVPLLVSQRAGKLSFFFIRLWAMSWLWMVGIKYAIYGLEHIKHNQPYIFIFNHRSFIDAPIIPIAINREIRAIGKKELSKIPVFGFILSRVAIWVDRKDTVSRKASVARLSAILKKGISIVVAPEGTRNDTNQTLLPFQKGAFRISVETGTPIMPMALIGSDQLMKRGSLLIWPGKIKIYFSPAIPPPIQQGESSYNSLADLCYNRLEAMLMIHE